jgi:hypothetical protein
MTNLQIENKKTVIVEHEGEWFPDQAWLEQDWVSEAYPELYTIYSVISEQSYVSTKNSSADYSYVYDLLPKEHELRGEGAHLFKQEARAVERNLKLAARALKLCGQKNTTLQQDEVLLFPLTSEYKTRGVIRPSYLKKLGIDKAFTKEQLEAMDFDEVSRIHQAIIQQRCSLERYYEREMNVIFSLEKEIAAHKAKLQLWQRQLNKWERNLNYLETELAFRGTLYTKCYQLARQLRNWWNKEQNDLLGLPTLTRG